MHVFCKHELEALISIYTYAYTYIVKEIRKGTGGGGDCSVELIRKFLYSDKSSFMLKKIFVSMLCNMRYQKSSA